MIKVKVGVSNRHVHLTEETYKLLFDEPLTIRNELSQLGEFASNQTITLKTPKDVIENVRVLGPLRNYNQVEISKTDAFKLGLNPPVRRSGNLEGSEQVTLVSAKGEVHLDEGVIIAERHLHLNPNDVTKHMHVDGQPIVIKVPGTKGLFKDHFFESIIAFIKISDNATLELHMDTDDANAMMLKNGDEVDVDL